MQAQWEGPFKVLKIVSKSAIVILKDDEKKLVHISQIKLYHKSDEEEKGKEENEKRVNNKSI